VINSRSEHPTLGDYSDEGLPVVQVALWVFISIRSRDVVELSKSSNFAHRFGVVECESEAAVYALLAVPVHWTDHKTLTPVPPSAVLALQALNTPTTLAR
jgi:hypothetical protein